MKTGDMTGPDDLEAEITARVLRDLQHHTPALYALLTSGGHEREVAAFHAGIAGGCKATVEWLAEQADADET